ncbi:type IV pilus modification protein PilV [Massilia soli]|uniref:Type IV pilus modification protein PilV n=1 Tax=Massilia soli TaxID=2792854 RepID=A0ABS7STX1_9BURK|nr:type IV pilus modification protein PilV [Massilia soli]MBZ2209394.1 type IV pilus modification protein PilV [Massilia soli]
MRTQRGFSLVEVLVTMLVVSIGLLGIAGLIVTSMKNNQSAQSRSQASVLANDIIDRMRANRSVAELSPSPYQIDLGDAADATLGVPGADLAEWLAAVEAGVPSGQGAVSFDAATGNVTVTVQWNDTRASGDGASVGLPAQQLVVETRL